MAGLAEGCSRECKHSRASPSSSPSPLPSPTPTTPPSPFTTTTFMLLEIKSSLGTYDTMADTHSVQKLLHCVVRTSSLTWGLALPHGERCQDSSAYTLAIGLCCDALQMLCVMHAGAPFHCMVNSHGFSGKQYATHVLRKYNRCLFDAISFLNSKLGVTEVALCSFRNAHPSVQQLSIW